jgi:alpha-beta hydrolase superfamily lysophospholipase
MQRTLLLRLACALVLLFLVSCSCSTPLTAKGQSPSLGTTTYTSFDGDRFPYQAWVPHSKKVQTVLIGFHGIAGASDDFENLAHMLLARNPTSAVYAPDLRGQGRDPLTCRRGDLHDPEEWFADAHTFSRLVRARHPKARVIWCGESMGSLIALHAFSSYPGDPPPCDALILSSPITRIHPERLSPAKRQLLCLMSATLPKVRLSLEGLSGETETRVTRDVVHQEQVNQNSWHVSRFTLRLFGHLERLITNMPKKAAKVNVPVLLLHGGKDVFSHPDDVVRFEWAFPAAPSVKRRYYPDSYHLLFYDHERERILKDTISWIEHAGSGN